MTKDALANVSDKKFSIGGTSRHNGRTTFRFANGEVEDRVTTLKRFGHTAIKLSELPKEMTKVQAIGFLTQENGIRAVLPTRSPDKRRKSPIQIAGEQMGYNKKAA